MELIGLTGLSAHVSGYWLTHALSCVVLMPDYFTYKTCQGVPLVVTMPWVQILFKHFSLNIFGLGFVCLFDKTPWFSTF